MLWASNNPAEIDGSEALWIRDLTLVESSYGRLVYIAGLRDPNTGRYDHFGSNSGSPSNLVASRMLKKIHERVFRDWVGFNLERKKADIELYIAGLGVDRCDLVDAWLRLTPYKNLVPASIQGPERQKHISDFEAILGLMKNVYGVASPDEGA